MSRWGGGRQSGDDLAYGDLPQRWDRSRFERLGGGPPRQYEEEYRFTERDRPGRRDVAVAARIDERGPRGRFEERDRYFEEDRYATGGPRRRTDRELFGDVDPRELANMAVTPYRRKSITREELDIDQRSPPPRPGILRRQSSLDTFDRRPIPRYEREEHRVPVYTPVPVPVPVRRREDEYEDYRRGRYYEPEDYREVEIQRERSVHRRASKPKSVKSSKAKSVTTKRSSSSGSESIQESIHESRHGGGAPSIHESFHESVHGAGGASFHESFHESIHGGSGSVHDSIQQTEKKFKKGKTRMPKRLVRREAIMDLGYPFDEEEDFFMLRIALEKEQIDEVIRISETYKNGEKKTVYKFEEKVDEAPALLAPPEPETEHEEITRTEWINPPTVAGSHRSRSRHHSRHTSEYGAGTTRHISPSRTVRSRRTSRATSRPADEFFEERKTVIEERSPPPPPPLAPGPPPPEFYEERKTVVEERDTISPSHHRSLSEHGTLVLQEREYRSDRDIQAEISRLEAERRALRLEREAEERRSMAVRIRERPEEEFQLVEYREPREAREVLEVYDRERSPPRNVLRVEKDRKGRMALVKSSH